MSFPASTTAKGVAFALPDVCNTPSPGGPVPVPYPNTGQLSTADDAVAKVLVDSAPVIVESSSIASSQGDEAGSQGGVTSGTVAGEIRFEQYSSKVFADGKKMVFATASTAQNGSNANAPAGLVAAPSQLKVLIKA